MQRKIVGLEQGQRILAKICYVTYARIYKTYVIITGITIAYCAFDYQVIVV